MWQARTARVSEREFLALPETLEKVELIDGEVFVTPSPNVAHQLIVKGVLFALEGWARGFSKPVTVGQAPLDIRFGRNRILQPDVFVIFEKIARSRSMPLDRVPEICIEVLSGNSGHDRVMKKFLYGEAGVQEYWVVDPNGLVEQWSGPGLKTGRELKDRLTSPLLPKFALDLRALFELPEPPSRKVKRRR